MLSQVGAGAIIGFGLGYALKKIAKVAVVFLSVAMLGLLWLQSQGVLTLHFERLYELLEQGVRQAIQLPEWLGGLTMLPLTGGFATGFILGLKRG